MQAINGASSENLLEERSTTLSRLAGADLVLGIDSGRIASIMKEVTPLRRESAPVHLNLRMNMPGATGDTR